MQLNLKSEVLALLFGGLIILLNFGDDRIGPTIGNLDTVFGLRFWPLMDVFFPLASIVIFLAYGKMKSNRGLKFNVQTCLPLMVYVFSLFLICVDDVSDVLNLGLTFPNAYWTVMMWLYPVVAFLSFFWFGETDGKQARQRIAGS